MNQGVKAWEDIGLRDFRGGSGNFPLRVKGLWDLGSMRSRELGDFRGLGLWVQKAVF